MKGLSRFWPWAAALLSGILLTACFPPWDQGWLAWVALAPLAAALWFGPGDGQRPLLRAALLGYATGLVFFWGAFFWLTTVTGLGWFLLAFYMALYPALWAVYVAWLRGGAGDFTRSAANLRLALCGAAAWTALEWVRGWLFSGFGWNGLGVALHGNLALIQAAEWTGTGGLSFLVAFVNLIAVITVRRFASEIAARRIRPHWDFTATMAFVAIVFLHGVRILFRLAPAGEEQLRVAAVQPNVPQEEKFDPAFEDRIFERLTFLSETALAWKPELLVWPESATPRGLFSDEKNFLFVRNLAAKEEFGFLLGSLDFDAQRRDYNIAALLTRRGEMIQIYRKIHLVPFGEYVPFRHSFPFFAWVVGELVPSDFTPGEKPVVLKMETPPVRLAPLICFEDTLGELTREFVRDGAQVMVNVTNDAWFLRSAGASQHLANAILRTVENRRPLVRAANTGVTAFIDSKGRVTQRFDALFTEGVLTGLVAVPPADAPLTFYTRYGDFFSQACGVLSIFSFLPLIARRRKPPL